jgi:hypothetical protein
MYLDVDKKQKCLAHRPDLPDGIDRCCCCFDVCLFVIGIDMIEFRAQLKMLPEASEAFNVVCILCCCV